VAPVELLPAALLLPVAPVELLLAALLLPVALVELPVALLSPLSRQPTPVA
jgi:hypothetical protein